MVVWLVFGRGMTEIPDMGMGAVATSSGPGEDDVEDETLIGAD
jgi:hypothetical protein